MRIIVCDDDQRIITEYTKALKQMDEEHDLKLNVSGCASGEKLLFQMPENPNEVDLIYMDIHFGEVMDGMEAAKKLRKNGYRNDIVFLTVNREKVFESFDVEPLHYFVKRDVSKKKFKEVLLKAVDRASSREAEILSLSCAGETRNIPLTDILYFEVIRRIITVHYGSEAFEFYSTMGKLENMLSQKGFVRIHRAFIVGHRHVASIKNNEVVMRDGTRLPVGRTYLKKLREKQE